MRTVKFHRQRNLASNQRIGHVGFGAPKDFEKRLVWIKKAAQTLKVNTLVYSMGEEADDIMVSFGLTADDATQYELVKNRFESHFIVRRNIIFERAKFNLRSQQEGESVETFNTDLHCLSEHCEFGVLKNELIRDRIVVGF